jgi:predicted secreted hydrolase
MSRSEAVAQLLIAAWLAVMLPACHPSEAPTHAANDMALLAGQADGFAQARPGHHLAFPRDHGSHPEYRLEWWYLTANLSDQEGFQYGAQWTLFRLAMTAPGNGNESVPGIPEPQNPWQAGQMYMAHMALSWPGGHAGFQRYARGGEHGGVAQAGVRAEPFSAWLDDWELRSTSLEWLPLEVRARQGDMALRLELESKRELVLQGDAGFSRKHANGGGSHYYSHPWLQAKGELIIAGKPVTVSGEAWLDREWSSHFLQADQVGWDWFALHLDSGEKLMLYRIRSRDDSTGAGHFQHGLLLGTQGQRSDLSGSQIIFTATEWASFEGRKLPVGWRIELPQNQRRLNVRALHPEQWMGLDFAYWEGVVEVTGVDSESASPANRGRGYLEMTGYR